MNALVQFIESKEIPIDIHMTVRNLSGDEDGVDKS